MQNFLRRNGIIHQLQFSTSQNKMAVLRGHLEPFVNEQEPCLWRQV